MIDCSKSIVGRVIGKGGETIKTMQKHFGANIQIDQQTDPMKITVSGQPAAVEAAAAAVQEIVNGGNPYLGGPGGPQGYGGGASHSLLARLRRVTLIDPCPIEPCLAVIEKSYDVS